MLGAKDKQSTSHVFFLSLFSSTVCTWQLEVVSMSSRPPVPRLWRTHCNTKWAEEPLTTTGAMSCFADKYNFPSIKIPQLLTWVKQNHTQYPGYFNLVLTISSWVPGLSWSCSIWPVCGFGFPQEWDGTCCHDPEHNKQVLSWEGLAGRQLHSSAPELTGSALCALTATFRLFQPCDLSALLIYCIVLTRSSDGSAAVPTAVP